MEKIPISIQLHESLLENATIKADELGVTVSFLIENSLYKDLNEGIEIDAFALLEHVCKIQEHKSSLIKLVNSLTESLELAE